MRALAIGLLFLVTACGGGTGSGPDTVAQDAGGDLPDLVADAVTIANELSNSAAVPPDAAAIEYLCPDGRLVTARYYGEGAQASADLLIGDTHYKLHHVAAASGTKYVGDAADGPSGVGPLLWWAKADRALLGEASEARETPMVECVEQDF